MPQYSAKASTAATIASTNVSSGGRNRIVPMTRGRSTSADRTRVMAGRLAGRGTLVCSPPGDRRLLDTAVAAVSLLIRHDGFEQMTLAEIRPQRVRHPDLGVGDLPQQEVADAHLAAR